MRPVETGAGQQPHRAAIEARMHAVAVEFDFVQPVRTFRRLLRERRQLWPDPGSIPAKRPRSAFLPIAPYGLSNLFDHQAAGEKRAEQLRFGAGEIKPGEPVGAVQDDHLPIVDGRDVGPGLGCEQGEGVPCPSGIGRQRPAKQNQSSPAFVNFHFDFGAFAPVNSKKCEAGMRQRPFGNRRPSERKLMIGAPFAALLRWRSRQC
jgi:hypothetical protein